MKGLLLVTAALILIPLISVFVPAKDDNSTVAPENITEAVAAMAIMQDDMNCRFIDTVNIYDIESGEALSVPIDDFLSAAVLGAISPTAEPELLKAQCVLMYTYILGKRMRSIYSPDTDIEGCDISTDSEKYIRLVFPDEADKLYSEKVPDYKSKIQSAIESCKGEYLAYSGRPIVPAYCFSCGGVTESAKTVLGEDVPYLKSVESEYDSEYVTEAVYSKEERGARLATAKTPITLMGEAKDWIVITDTNDTGYVKQLLLDGKHTISGTDFAALLSLPSARFTFEYSEKFESFTFKVSGVGHLVGLSQYGANEMAKRGSGYEEILKKYFTSVEIEKSNGIK